MTPVTAPLRAWSPLVAPAEGEESWFVIGEASAANSVASSQVSTTYGPAPAQSAPARRHRPLPEGFGEERAVRARRASSVFEMPDLEAQRRSFRERLAAAYSEPVDHSPPLVAPYRAERALRWGAPHVTLLMATMMASALFCLGGGTLIGLYVWSAHRSGPLPIGVPKELHAASFGTSLPLR